MALLAHRPDLAVECRHWASDLGAPPCPGVPWHLFVPASTVVAWGCRPGHRDWRSSERGSSQGRSSFRSTTAPTPMALSRWRRPHGEDRAHQDEYRPGGSRLELYVVNADGSGSWGCWKPRDSVALLRTSRSDPAWSPDGRKIAFLGMADDGNTDVYVVRADGLGRKRLTRHPGVDGNPAWSPDGRKIAFTRGDRECCAEPRSTS